MSSPRLITTILLQTGQFTLLGFLRPRRLITSPGINYNIYFYYLIILYYFVIIIFIIARSIILLLLLLLLLSLFHTIDAIIKKNF